MKIIETFLKLTSQTYPYGTESEVFELLPNYLDFDEFGNRYLQIGDNPSCMFTSHLDTATALKTEVKHIIDGNICKTDGTSILGADDKAGVTIMLWMIWNKVPGLYYFFLGEEVGCIGSKALAAKHKTEKIESIKKVISFDRRGKDSVITFQASSRCCSDLFAKALSAELNKNKTFNYSPDPSGIWTDSAQFTSIYPECTNISVGYKHEHTSFETQDLEHLEQLADTCLNIDWESLPVERDPSVVEYKYSSYYGDWDDDFYGSSSRYYGSRSRYYGPSGYYGKNNDTNNSWSNTSVFSSPYDNKKFFFDELTNHVSSIVFIKGTQKIASVEFSEERLEIEKALIADLLESLEVEYNQFTWDGTKLTLRHNEGSNVLCDRSELEEFIPKFNFWKNILEKNYAEDNELVF